MPSSALEAHNNKLLTCTSCPLRLEWCLLLLLACISTRRKFCQKLHDEPSTPLSSLPKNDSSFTPRPRAWPDHLHGPGTTSLSPDQLCPGPKGMPGYLHWTRCHLFPSMDEQHRALLLLRWGVARKWRRTRRNNAISYPIALTDSSRASTSPLMPPLPCATPKEPEVSSTRAPVGRSRLTSAYRPLRRQAALALIGHVMRPTRNLNARSRGSTIQLYVFTAAEREL
ncbi:hypothetical protein BC936DRAFT_149936 [Jimgerdemannia flammicorona]|uniref:Uncharacterized protein n=1 Tax=Jimgerdemannia flammicorona TaxID=994334 RepID=A0A433DJW9_9FUNG|nr:hypothetical protein BC936DRAFT_149936 [Jimgerdemannia flammicorona]